MLNNDKPDDIISKMRGFYTWISRDSKVLRTTIVLVFDKKDVPADDRGENVLKSYY